VTETRDSKRHDAVAETPRGRPPATSKTLDPPPSEFAVALPPHDRAVVLPPSDLVIEPPPGDIVVAPSPADLVVRPATSADLPAILTVVRAAFGYDLEAMLVARLERERRVAASVVAASDGRIVGHALLSRVPLTAPGQAALAALALAPVAVAPDHQGRGIGNLVVRACVGLVDPRLPVFVIGDPAFYGRFGFEPAAPHRVRQRFGVAPGHFLVRFAGPPPADLVERTLDYPAAFDGC
jgi:putative acetyltransferase